MSRHLVSLEFRKLSLQYFPAFPVNPHYVRLFSKLVFATRNEDGGVPVSQFTLACLEGKVRELHGNNYCGRHFLEEFRDQVMPALYWSNWSVEDKLCRVAYPNFSPEFERAIEQEILHPVPLRERVYLGAGCKWHPAKAVALRKQLIKKAAEFSIYAQPEALPLIQYLNNLSPNSFTSIVRANKSEALRAIENLKSIEQRKAAINQLEALEEIGMPIYVPSSYGNTARIFSMVEGLPLLNKAIRKVLCQGWTEFDLQNSQLAIVATLWDIPKLREYLETGQSFWEAMFAHYKLQTLREEDDWLYEEVKDLFKTALYSLVFGMRGKTARHNLTKGLKQLKPELSGKTFMKHPLIQDLLAARELNVQKIIQQGGAETVFGKWVDLTTHRRYGTEGEEAAVRSIQAEIAQAAELWLLLPVLETAQQTNRFRITLWQHDGFSGVFESKSLKDTLTRKLYSQVAERARQGGFVTKLGWKDL